ncbi:protein CTLA-2-alpha [Eurosta solidaginis]|uniref:protein CTLA-2-alpha n=1 Tax=Eurosta solidaginis TaxID=178769 RepID=UPI003530F2BE
MCTFKELTTLKRFLLTLLTLVVFCSACLAADECSENSWQLYKSEFKKQYNSVAEEARRRSIFCNNIHMIHSHNERYKRGEVTFEMGVNQFADLSSDEFRRWLHGESVGFGSVLV